jgi:hypothetical protein
MFALIERRRGARRRGAEGEEPRRRGAEKERSREGEEPRRRGAEKERSREGEESRREESRRRGVEKEREVAYSPFGSRTTEPFVSQFIHINISQRHKECLKKSRPVNLFENE